MHDKEYADGCPMTKKTISITSALIIVLVVSILLPAPAVAVPQQPHRFYGEVTVGGSSAADGLEVAAKIGGVTYKTATTSGGKYGYSPLFKVPADDADTSAIEGGVDGDTIYFYVEGVAADNYSFETGGSTQLNLSISALPTPAPVTPPTPTAGVGAGVGLAGVTSVLYVVTQTGRFTEDVIARSEDKNVELFIPEDTIGLNRMGSLLSSISIKVMVEPPDPPVYFKIIPPVYDIGPYGATFDPPIDLTIKYDESKIPEGVAEKNLVIAWWDKTTGEWIKLESTVDPEADTITAKVDYFAPFAVLAPIRPASFTVADLSITPAEVDFGEGVSISVLVTNTGDLTGSYEVSLKIDDVVVQTKEVTLDGGDSETISFSVTPDIAGERTVNISGLLGTFMVKVPKAPAAFTTSALIISPVEVNIGESITISVTVTNIGDLTGTYKVTLMIDGIAVATKEVTIARGASQKVAFTTVKDTAGTYAVEIDGLRGSFVVREKIPPPPPAPPPVPPVAPPVPAPPPEVPPVAPVNWWLIGGIIAAVIIIGVVAWLVAARRRS